jgi:cyclase
MPANLRLIARLDVKGPDVIKGVHLEGLRKMGDPQEIAQRYYQDGVDEIIYMDVVASLYGRNNLTDIVRRTAENVFIPITVGGGIRSIDDARVLLRSGADKVAINTAATQRPETITELAECFGSQCIVLSIEAKRNHDSWEVYTDNGREKSGRDVLEWAMRGEALGAGEILLTSIDQEGTCKGFDLDLIQTVSEAVGVPVLSSGGMGETNHMVEAFSIGKADAVAMAHVLHYNELNLETIRQAAKESGLSVRFH